MYRDYLFFTGHSVWNNFPASLIHFKGMFHFYSPENIRKPEVENLFKNELQIKIL